MSPVISSRRVAMAVEAMIRSWAPRGRPWGRTAMSISAWGCRNGAVVFDNRNRVLDGADELPAVVTIRLIGQRHPHEQFGQRDRCDGHLIVIGDRFVERTLSAVCVNQEGRVEKEAAQRSRSPGAAPIRCPAGIRGRDGE